jgi:hypothetical protein
MSLIVFGTHLDFTFITAFGEVLFILWLWIRGWKVQEPAVIPMIARLG